MKLDTAIEMIQEAARLEDERKQMEKKRKYPVGTPNEGSMTRHDELLRIARRILLEHYYYEG